MRVGDAALVGGQAGPVALDGLGGVAQGLLFVVCMFVGIWLVGAWGPIKLHICVHLSTHLVGDGQVVVVAGLGQEGQRLSSWWYKRRCRCRVRY